MRDRYMIPVIVTSGARFSNANLRNLPRAGIEPKIMHKLCKVYISTFWLFLRSTLNGETAKRLIYKPYRVSALSADKRGNSECAILMTGRFREILL